jgi:DNA (cytosine-5)-methyltransferase 1
VTVRRSKSKRGASAPRPVAVDVFCGAGGMSLGFEQAGFDVLAAIDSDPVHLAVHEYNFPHAHAVCADASGVSVEQVETAVRKGWSNVGRPGEWDGTIDCLLGGPSCQGFSDMGRQKADDPRNELIFEFARLVEDLRPRTFVMENVPGLLFSKVSGELGRLMKRLRSAGYKINNDSAVCLDAADFGVPQRRRRVFLIGVAPDLALPRSPRRRTTPTVREALNDLPNVDDFPELVENQELRLSRALKTKMARAASPYAKSLRGRYAREYSRDWDSNVLAGCQRTQHTDEVRQRFALLVAGEQDAASRTSRLDASGVAQTLRAGTGRDHGSFTAPRPIHHLHSRVITVREAARLHSFPDWFRFHVTKWHALREIGNAVPPRLASAVAATLLAPLDYSLSAPTGRVELGRPELLSMSLREAARHYDYDEALLPYDVRRKSMSG